jgi:hypothetical protein
MAKKRGVAYTLITNLIGSLDAAAIRSGRFDRKLGIYPPDPVSQQGRLLDQFLAFHQKEKIPLPDDLADRVRSVIQQTAGLSLGDLIRKGWFLRPADRDSIAKGTPFDHLMNLGGLPSDLPEPDTRLDSPPRTRDGMEPARAAEREYRQLAWIQKWDQQVREAAKDDLAQALADPPSQIPSPESPASASPVYLSLGPRTLDGFPSILVQVLSGNGNGEAGGAKPEQPPGSAAGVGEDGISG